MKPTLRWMVLGSALVATLAAAAWVKEEDGSGAASGRSAGSRRALVGTDSARAPVSPRASSTVDQVALAADQLKFPERKSGAPINPESVVNAFAVKSWYVAPPAPPPSAAPPTPPKPVAPPLPFTFMGRMTDPAGRLVVYLVKGDQSYPVRGGETLEGQYRVEKIDAAQIEFTYLPLKEKQILAIGASE